MLTRRPSRHDDAGMTLTEVLVGSTLMLIVGTLAMTFFVSTNAQTSRDADASFATAKARVAMTSIVSALRLADSPTTQPGYPTARFLTLTPSSVVFFSNLNPAARAGTADRSAPSKVSISVVSSQLVESTYAPLSATSGDYTNNYSSTPTSTVSLADTLGNTDVFTYCTTTTDPNSTAAGQGCTATTAGESVASVGIKLVLPGLRGETAQTLTSTVAITGAVS